MKHLYLLLLFAGFTIHAQTYTWQWAKQGGGTQGWWDSTVSPLGDEMIRDVVVDSQNNSYYLSAVYPGNPNLQGNPLTSYSPYDLVIFSLDCSGNFRWATTLGGHGGSEQAWKLALDNEGGL